MTRTNTVTEAPLTVRQREVVALIAAGCPLAESADA